MINSVMNRLQDFTFFSQLMANANMGWWKANLSTANYECSDFIVELLGLDQTGIISFEDFNKRIQKEEQLSTTIHSYGVYQRDRKSTRLNSSHSRKSRMPSSA